MSVSTTRDYVMWKQDYLVQSPHTSVSPPPMIIHNTQAAFIFEQNNDSYLPATSQKFWSKKPKATSDSNELPMVAIYIDFKLKASEVYSYHNLYQQKKHKGASPILLTDRFGWNALSSVYHAVEISLFWFPLAD